jgi:peptidyl-prolyl cis-trans isomerase C
MMSVSVNGTVIPEADINRESGNYQGGSIPERQQHAARALVIRELLRQRADVLGIAPGDDEDARLDAVIDREAPIPRADEAACRRYYDNNPERFRSEPLIEARHILLAAAPEDFDGRDEQRELAESLIAQLRRHPDAFAEFARRHSACPSKDSGGHLGQISRGQTVPEFEAAVLRLPVGLAEPPVESRYGWHVVEVVQRVEGTRLPFEAVRERIAEYLTERSRRRAFSQYVRLLVAEARIEGVELEGAESPLLQ